MTTTDAEGQTSLLSIVPLTAHHPMQGIVTHSMESKQIIKPCILTSAVCLLALSTVRSVAICSRLELSRDRKRKTSSSRTRTCETNVDMQVPLSTTTCSDWRPFSCGESEKCTRGGANCATYLFFAFRKSGLAGGVADVANYFLGVFPGPGQLLDRGFQVLDLVAHGADYGSGGVGIGREGLAAVAGGELVGAWSRNAPN